MCVCLYNLQESVLSSHYFQGIELKGSVVVAALFPTEPSCQPNFYVLKLIMNWKNSIHVNHELIYFYSRLIVNIISIRLFDFYRDKICQSWLMKKMFM